MSIRCYILAALLSGLGTAPAQPVLAEEPAPCRTALQGKIAWDGKGHTAWDEASLDRLCADVTSDEPARCFERVMHGGVDWGHGTKWRMGAAIDLCQGTTSAAATIQCFERQLLDNVEFADAVDACARKRRRGADRKAPAVSAAPSPPPAPASASTPPAPAAAPVPDTDAMLLDPAAAPVPETASIPPAPVDAPAPATAAAREGNPQGAIAGDCGGEREVLCAYLVADCAPACRTGAESSACRNCIAAVHTMGVDCWACLYGGTGSGAGAPPAPSFACRDFVCAAGDGASSPRVRGPAGRIAEVCGPCRTADARRSIRRCCLVAGER